MESLSLYELNALVRRSLEQCLPDECWVQAELSDVRTNSTGHCYLEFVQKDPRSNSLIAKARGTIWANVFRLLKPYFEEATGQAFVSGIKVLVQVTVNFHELYGYSLTVQDIDPTYTLGDMARRRREILKQLEEEGVLTLNKELDMPCLPQRIAVISSPTAAGYGDFCHQLKNNSKGFFFYTELFPALMQGDRVEESVLSALDRVNARLSEFDVVVIIRGGGATSDLSGFDTYLLAAACAQFPLPILTGIGHERDDTVLDSVAHTRVKTPTAAAEFLIESMDSAADKLEMLASRLHEGVRNLLQQEQRKLLVTRTGFLLPHTIVYPMQNGFADCAERCGAGCDFLFVPPSPSPGIVATTIGRCFTGKVVARGYSITLKDGKVVKNADELQENDMITTRLQNGEVVSIVHI